MKLARILCNLAATAALVVSQSPLSGQSTGGEITKVPRCVECPPPEPPPRIAKGKHDVTVVLRVLITTEGRCENVTVVKSVSPEIDETAIATVKGWKLKPAIGPDGKPVPAHTLIEVVFRGVDVQAPLRMDLNELAVQLGKSIHKEAKKKPVRVLVIPFPLRQQISAILSQSARLEVVPAEEFAKLLERENLEPEHFQSSQVIG